ncbi:MAG: hypothetical protein HRU19_04615 [Pseudobacteriovorax sp.]|nr:hypothetical protein [Pseudobacteriovorax sp.]
MPWKIIWIELLHSKKFSLLFLLNLSIGLLGFIGLDAFKTSFSKQLEDAARNLLTADVSVSSRRNFNPEEVTTIKDLETMGAKVSEKRSLYSMAASPTRSALVEINAIDDRHPLIGSITLDDTIVIESDRETTINSRPEVWVSSEVITQFGVRLGETLRIGSLDFVVAHVITDDTGVSLANTGYAPRIYMGLSQLDETGLIKQGTTSRQTFNILLGPDQDTKGVTEELFNRFDNTVRVTNFLKSGQDNGRILSYLTDYLGLVSLVALFLSGVGTFYLFRSYMAGKQKEIAVLLTLGLSGRKATIIYTIQLVSLGGLAAVLASASSFSLLPLGIKLLGQFSPVAIELNLTMSTLGAAMILGIFTPFFLCLPLLLAIGDVKPSMLFQEFNETSFNIRTKQFLGFIPALIAGYLLSVWQAHSYFIGSLFYFGVVFSSLLIAALGLFLLSFVAKLSPKSFSLRFATSYLTRNRLSSLTCFLALSLSTMLINLIPQLESTLLKEISRPEGEQLPSLFVFDIQAEQEAPLSKLLNDNEAPASFLAPMIRGRLKGINGEELDKGSNERQFSREDERAQRMRNREANLSYGDELNASETIVAGQPFSGTFQGDFNDPGEVSIEERYAGRLGIKLGDTLNFDIQGLSFDGTVVNLRKVKWNSFKPNFFIKFQSGVIDDAPKTYLAAIPPMGFDKKIKIQNQIVEAFPNISIIDVSKVVEKLTEVISQMSQILKVMAWLSVIAGLVVTLSIANHKAQERLWDINLLKVLGTPFKNIRNIVVWEFAMLSGAAALFGVIVSAAASYILGRFVFGGLWGFDIVSATVTTSLVIILCLAVSQLASHRVLRSKPQLYL